MIKEITIKNFKSIADLTLELGRFNVLIGENGSGKTNILEAVAFGAAAAADKLDNEFLSSRGIRVTSPEFMRAAFSSPKKNGEISIEFVGDTFPTACFRLKNDNSKSYSKWIDLERRKLMDDISAQVKKEHQAKPGSSPLESASEQAKEFMKRLFERITEDPALVNFIIFSPENTMLRTFEKEGQILPLGIKGEGLFKLIKNLSMDKDKKPMEEIKENLKLMDWFEDFQLPEASAPNEFVLKIKDRFLNSELNYFDQRSSNEGFLFLLFYLALFISKDTPEFFAVDNLEASFNPKLCAEVSKTLIRLCKKKKKQVIVTTQNPSILDGINLNDRDERLFVIKRNTQGHTIAKRITIKPETKTPVKLSDAWTRGYIGGLPKNF